MASEDAYGNKKRYERRLTEVSTWVQVPEAHAGTGRRMFRRKYRIQHAGNLPLFSRLADVLASRDISYVRRNRYLDVLLFLCAHIDKTLDECSQADVDKVVAAGHKANVTRNSKTTFLRMLDCVLKGLTPGRFKVELRIERSIENEVERVSFEEICRLIRYLKHDEHFRAFITTILETYVRPQELVWRTMKDVEVFREAGRATYVKIRVSSHGKEGTKTIVIKDTLCYFMDWLERHPRRNQPGAYLFPNMQDYVSRLSPVSVTKKLKQLKKKLGIRGRLCAYEIKSRGITFACMRNDAPKLIQARARWANMDPLVHYDKTSADELLDADLAREGLLKLDQVVDPIIRPKDCPCGEVVGFAETDCPRCGCETTEGMIRKLRGGEEAGVGRKVSRVDDEPPNQELLTAIATLLKNPEARTQLQRMLTSVA